MNKTIKTIAWICLILGLLGVAADVGMYVRGRIWASEMQEAFLSGEMPERGGRFSDGDSENKPENRDRINKDGQPGSFRKSGGMGGASLPGGRTGFAGIGRGTLAMPFFMMAAGPVLTVVGGVMLLVNREPKPKKEEKATKKTKEAKS